MATLQTPPRGTADPAVGVPRRYAFTPEQFHRLAAAGILPPDARLELVEGDIYEMPPEGPEHATARLRTARYFARHETDRWHVRAEAPLRLGDSEPVPDVCVVIGKLEDYATAHPTSALLVIEVADTLVAYDQTAKAQLYARAGIPEYWIVNLAERRLEIYRDPAPTGYQAVHFYTPNETVQLQFEPTLRVQVSDLLP